ncbi:MAG: hypothetical protein JJE46_06790 [Acidimicrobiia bacterium]|nr:hypothetical protein [Acidimicrobiia bacterium]
MNEPPPDFEARSSAFEDLVGSAQVPQLLIQIAREKTRILAANQAAETLLARDDLVGADLMDLQIRTEFEPDDGAWAAVFAGELDVVGHRRRYRRGDGRTAIVDAFAFTLQANATGVVMLVVLAEPARTDWMLKRMRLDVDATNALSELRAALLAGASGEELTSRICESTTDLIEATNVGVLRLDGPDHVRLTAILDPTANPTGARWRIVDDAFGRALRESRVACFTVPESTSATFRVASGTPVQVAMAPLTAGTQRLGSLMVRRDARPFTDEELALLGTYADGASKALTLAESRTEIMRLRAREEIARDLHDEVIQDLVAVRLGLASLALEVKDEKLGRKIDERLGRKVGELLEEVDQATKQLRDVVRGLDDVATTDGFRAALVSLTTRRAERAGMGWSVEIDETVADALTADERREFMSVVNEAVSNVVRHSDGTQIDVRLDSTAGRAELTVCDDGVGLGTASRSGGHGLRNILARATDLGGDCVIEEREHGGTKLSWWIPLDRRR